MGEDGKEPKSCICACGRAARFNVHAFVKVRQGGLRSARDRGDNYQFNVLMGKPNNVDRVKIGTKAGGSGSSFMCLMSGTPMPFDYLRMEAKSGRMGARLMAIVAESVIGRVYLSPTPEHEEVSRDAKPEWKPDIGLPDRALGFRVQEYGMTKWSDLFTARQLVALTTIFDLISEAMLHVRRDALQIELSNDPSRFATEVPARRRMPKQ